MWLLILNFIDIPLSFAILFTYAFLPPLSVVFPEDAETWPSTFILLLSSEKVNVSRNLRVGRENSKRYFSGLTIQLGSEFPLPTQYFQMPPEPLTVNQPKSINSHIHTWLNEQFFINSTTGFQNLCSPNCEGCVYLFN